jgi:hypothetical protein
MEPMTKEERDIQRKLKVLREVSFVRRQDIWLIPCPK